jgi:hypothetical protein
MRGAAGGCVLAERRVGGAVAARGLLCVRELGVGAGGGADEERQQAEEGDCEMQRLLHPFFHLFIPAPLDAGTGEWVLPVCREDFGMRVFWMRGAASEIRESFALALASILQV